MIKKRMEWVNLKDDYCPSCYQELNENDTHYICECGFSISKSKHDQIIKDMDKEADDEY